MSSFQFVEQDQNEMAAKSGSNQTNEVKTVKSDVLAPSVQRNRGIL